MATGTTDQRQSPPYVAFATFKNFIASLKAGIPSRIDKSVMPGLSGGTQSQLLAALRFLSLIGANGEPTDELEQLVGAHGSHSWSEVLGAMIRTAYIDILDGINLTTATPQQIAERFRDPAVGKLEGSTADKAERFLLSAIKEAKIEHSKRLIARKPRAGGKRQKKSPGASSAPAQAAGSSDDHHHGDSSETMTVPIYFHGKAAGKIIVPKSITPDDCKMVKIAVQMVEAFAAASGAPASN